MSGEAVLSLFASAIGVALLVVSLAFPPVEQVVRVKREPIYVRVQDSPWTAMPELTAGLGHPAEPK